MKRLGRRGKEYIKWRDEIGIPYLDKKYGHVCSSCGGRSSLDVAHVKKRSTHPHLKMELSNIKWLCRSCHRREHGTL